MDTVDVDMVLRHAVTTDVNTTAIVPTDHWNSIQLSYLCCGVTGEDGYDQWRDYLNDTYPDSCCTLKYPGCGQQAMATLSSDFANTFSDRMFTNGCVSVFR